MSKLINEDWEHAAYTNDEIYRAERNHKMELEYEQWKYEQNLYNLRRILTSDKSSSKKL